MIQLCYVFEKKNVFKIVPVEKHFKFEKSIIKIDQKSKKNQQLLPSLEEEKKPAPKLTKLGEKRQMFNKIMNDQRKATIAASRDTLFVPRTREAESQEQGKQKRKKKGLTEKDLDFKQEFDDDQEEDEIQEEDEEEEENEDNLSEDGRKMRQLLEEQQVDQQEQFKPLNLNFEIEKEDEVIARQADGGTSEIDKKEEEEVVDEDDEDSSMASIFGDEENGDNHNSQSLEVGSKRGYGQSGINGGNEGGDKKRPRNQ